MSDKKEKNYKVYEYVIFYAPENGEGGAVIKKDVMLEADERTVLIKAAREIPETYLSKIDEVKILIRPF